jgi:hypothetical protein
MDIFDGRVTVTCAIAGLWAFSTPVWSAWGSGGAEAHLPLFPSAPFPLLAALAGHQSGEVGGKRPFPGVWPPSGKDVCDRRAQQEHAVRGVARTSTTSEFSFGVSKRRLGAYLALIVDYSAAARERPPPGTCL